MELKIKSLDGLSDLLCVLSTEGYSYSVQTVYDTNTCIERIDYYLVTIKE